jgi:ammonia channel protein AmtB
MGVKAIWRDNQQVRRSVVGGISGAIAGITAATFEAPFMQRYGVAIVIGLIVFVALNLLVD